MEVEEWGKKEKLVTEIFHIKIFLYIWYSVIKIAPHFKIYKQVSSGIFPSYEFPGISSRRRISWRVSIKWTINQSPCFLNIFSTFSQERWQEKENVHITNKETIEIMVNNNRRTKIRKTKKQNNRIGLLSHKRTFLSND